ncbi:MAG: response regulator [Woeseiaceae bacterium]|nr:response regulator [Woeseiaceae bacterium]
MKTRILLVDDHAIFVEGLSALLRNEPQLEVIGTVTRGQDAVRAAREQRPDLVLMDLSMPDMSGVEATLLIKNEQPKIKILCLSMHADRGFVMGSLEAGASGYLLKDGAKAELLSAVKSVMSDQVYLSPAVASFVVDAARSDNATPAIELLTMRERQVLKLLARGKSTKAIAHRLHLSVKTVGTHRANLMDKLKLNSIAELTKFAIREGLSSLDN